MRKTDDDVSVIGVVVGIDGSTDELEVGTGTSDRLLEDSDEADIERLSLIEDIVDDVTASDEKVVDDGRGPIEEDELIVPVDSLTTDEVAIGVLAVTLNVGDRVRYDVENELSDIVTVVGVAVGTEEIEIADVLELFNIEVDLSKDEEEDVEVPIDGLTEISLLLEDTPDSEVDLSELMVHDVIGDDVDSVIIVDLSDDDDPT